MKTILIILFFVIGGNKLAAQNNFTQENKRTEVTVIDSLDCFTYDVRKMTLLLRDKQINYSVVFDTATQRLKNEYIQVHGTYDYYTAIKKYGEKYRKGLFVYAKEGEVTYE